MVHVPRMGAGVNDKDWWTLMALIYAGLLVGIGVPLAVMHLLGWAR